MPSVKNPNGPSKNRLAARTATARKHTTKRAARETLHASLTAQSSGRITKADARRGARSGILPTSGPNKAVSGKKARKLERKMGYALQRKMEEAEAEAEAEGEVVVMKDVDVADESEPKTKKQQKKKNKVKKGVKEGDATVDMDDIS
ncbi:hypothetical protein CIB48_g57 [Xylaria polymorpha]|nr:hypothetical protein CIB48_g57 [Xylaria polymorpha]